MKVQVSSVWMYIQTSTTPKCCYEKISNKIQIFAASLPFSSTLIFYPKCLIQFVNFVTKSDNAGWTKSFYDENQWENLWKGAV